MVLSKVTLATLLWSDSLAESLGDLCKMQIPSITFKEALPTFLPLWGKYPSNSSTNGSGSYRDSRTLGFIKGLSVWDLGNNQNFSRETHLPIAQGQTLFSFLKFC